MLFVGREVLFPDKRLTSKVVYLTLILEYCVRFKIKRKIRYFKVLLEVKITQILGVNHRYNNLNILDDKSNRV